MQIKKFSKSQALNFGWETTKSNLGFFIVIFLIIFFILSIPIFIQHYFGEKVLLVNIIVVVLNLVLSSMIPIGLIKISLKLYDTQKPTLRDLFSGGRLLLPYLIGFLMYLLIVLGGFILLIIPGIIWFVKFSFFGYFIVEKGMEPSEALRRSSVITQAVKWDLFVFGLLLLLINLLGAAALLIGLFVTLPVTIVASTFVYRTLLSRVKIK